MTTNENDDIFDQLMASADMHTLFESADKDFAGLDKVVQENQAAAKSAESHLLPGRTPYPSAHKYHLTETCTAQPGRNGGVAYLDVYGNVVTIQAMPLVNGPVTDIESQIGVVISVNGVECVLAMAQFTAALARLGSALKNEPDPVKDRWVF